MPEKSTNPETKQVSARTKKPVQLTLEARSDVINFEKREITGTILEYGVIGSPSIGAAKFAPGSVKQPADISRVKLLTDHNRNAAAVGYATTIEDNGETLTATFHIPEGEAGDLALREASAGLRDGLSVGVTLTDYRYADDGETVEIIESELHEVSLVTIPAFANARVQLVAANNLDFRKKETPTMNTQTFEPVTAASEQPAATVTAAAMSEQPAAAPSVPALQPPALQAGGNQAAQFSLAGISAEFARQANRGIPLANIAESLNTLAVEAAGKTAAAHPFADNMQKLADDPGKAYTMPQFVYELWQASRTGRRWFDSNGLKQALKAMTVQGYRFKLTDKPKPGEFAGEGAPIPSQGKIVTEMVTENAVRRAGGWTVDRALVDLGDPQIINAIFTAAFNEYLLETESWLVQKLLAEATTVTKGENLAETLTKLGIGAAKIGAKIDTIDLAPDVWEQFVSLKSDAVPWWLRNQGEINLGTTTGNAGGLSFSSNPDLQPGTILAGDTRAFTPYELPDMVKINAVNLAHGAIDLGLFGYISAIVNDPRAIFKVTA